LADLLAFDLPLVARMSTGRGWGGCRSARGSSSCCGCGDDVGGCEDEVNVTISTRVSNDLQSNRCLEE
jgi:hypothetical protein